VRIEASRQAAVLKILVPVRISEDMDPTQLDETVEWLRNSCALDTNSFGELKLICNY
jgi:hypothetical protein